MVQIPDSLRQQLAPVVKHRFSILAALVPLILLPALFMASGELRGRIARERATIDGHLSALRTVRDEPDHPNAKWAEALEARTAAVREELLREWTMFWESQASLRVWPADLGPDFLAAITALESDRRGELEFRALQRYQNTIRDIVRRLPQRMGCEELMADLEGGPSGQLPGRQQPGFRGVMAGQEEDDPEASLSQVPLIWEAEDQRRLYASFVWDSVPSTVQVVLAQEELWVYGLFCDTIRTLNDGAKGAFDAAVTTVEELAVGYPAAEDNPGGLGSGRVFGVRQPGPAMGTGGFEEGLPPPEFGMEGSGKPQGRPPHARFSGAGGGFEGVRPGSGETGRRSPDDAFQEWIYVDFTGRPLTAGELASSPDARLVHLMPFVLRVVMDQRQLDRLLAELAGNTIPIDVRQVRINPRTSGSGSDPLGGGGMVESGVYGDSGGRRRPFDVTVELRGTVGLATPPEPAVLSGGPGAGAAGQDAMEQDGGE